MTAIKKMLKLPREEYYMKHLEIINPLLPTTLTPKEIEVLANFMCLQGDITHDRFGTSARKIVQENVNISVAGMSNYMKSLKAKGFITDTSIAPILFPDDSQQDYQFILINYDS